eukprot:4252677-Pyramimonas_sp.AAC.1
MPNPMLNMGLGSKIERFDGSHVGRKLTELITRRIIVVYSLSAHVTGPPCGYILSPLTSLVPPA